MRSEQDKLFGRGDDEPADDQESIEPWSSSLRHQPPRPTRPSSSFMRLSTTKRYKYDTEQEEDQDYGLDELMTQ